MNIKTMLFNIVSALTIPGVVYEKDGLLYEKIDTTSCDNEYCMTVNHYWLIGQKGSGRWVRVRQVEFIGELREMKE